MSKVITPKTLPKTRLSDLIESVVFDIQRLVKMGFRIKMSRWFDPGHTTNSPCMVCLGGAAALGFMTNDQIADLKRGGMEDPERLAAVINNGCEEDVVNMIYMFNSLRNKDFDDVAMYYNCICDKHIVNGAALKSLGYHTMNSYSGKLTNKDVSKMLEQYTAFVAKLREAGY